MIWCQCVELKFNLAMLDGVHNMIWCHLGGTGGSLMVLYNGCSSRTWLLMCIVWSTMYLIGQKISSDKEYLDNLQQLPLANSVNRTSTVWSLTDHLMVLSLVALFTEVWCPPMPMWLYVCVRAWLIWISLESLKGLQIWIGTQKGLRALLFEESVYEWSMHPYSLVLEFDKMKIEDLLLL